MSDVLRENISIYVKGLPKDAKERYFEKLTFNHGTETLPDPFVIEEKLWVNDPCLWPDLDFGQIYLYLIETPSLFSPSSMKAYKSLEAYKYVESGHVQEVKYFSTEGSPFCFLKAKVLPSMKTTDIHQAWVCVNKDTADIYCSHCTCIAGLGEMCSHIAAILFKVELGVRFGLTQKAVTSEACKWNQVFKKQIEPHTVMEIQHLLNSNRKKTVECVIPSGSDPLPDQETLLSLHQVCPDASFFSLIPPMTDEQQPVPKPTQDLFPPTLTSFHSEEFKGASAEELEEKSSQFLSTYQCTSEQINNLFQRTKTQNISSLWYEHRKGRITGTKAHDILTRKDSTPPENLIMRVMDYKSYNLSKKDAVKWGLDNEIRVRTAYVKNNMKYHRNLKCEASGFRISDRNYFFGATADGVVSCECCGRGTLEIKCPFKHRTVTLETAATTDSTFCLDQNMNLKPKHRYYTQVQFQMAVFNTCYTDFVVMTEPNSEMNLAIVRVFRDDSFCELLFIKCSVFFLKHVVPEILTRKLMDRPPSDEVEQSCRRTDEMPKWCLCNEPEYGKMIICDSDNCGIGWFHYPCVNIKRKPRGRWLCPNCKR